MVNYRKQANLTYDLGASYLNLANVYCGWGKKDEGYTYYDSALVILRNFPEKEGYAAAISALGSSYTQDGMYNEALPLLQEAYEIRKQQGQAAYLVTTQLNLGKTYLSLGQLKKAKQMLDTVLNAALELRIKEHIKQAYGFLSDYYDEVGGVKNAYKNFQFYHAYSDSIVNEDVNTKIAEMQTKFDTEKKQQEINRLSQEKLISDLVIKEKNSQLLILFLAFVLVVVFSMVFYQLYKIRQERKLNEVVIEEQQKGLEAVILATEKERQRIAKDLHDGIGQTLSGIKLGLSKFSNNLISSEKDEFDNILNVVDEACTDVRSISHQMMPKALKEKGLVVALEEMLHKSLGISKITYHFEELGVGDIRFKESLEVGLYRIAQELINNIIKHSGATEVGIQISKTKKHLLLVVEDNGKGFKFDENKDGIGLMNMKNRVNTIKGEINYETDNQKGTIATIRVPLHG